MHSPLLVAAVALAIADPASAGTRNFSVTGFDRIRVDGPYSVKVTTGVAPFARATGSSAALDGVAIEVNGRTLVVHPSRSSWGGYPGKSAGPVEIEVGTHELTAAWVNGAGGVDINKVKGLLFDLSVQGAGSARIGTVAVDQLKVGIGGTASATLAGKTGKLTTLVRGNSSLDGANLDTKDVNVGAEGPATVRLAVSNSAKINASGPAQVILTGGPACTVTAAGSASVTGCD